MTATWARLAASATRVKSLRKASVEGGLLSCGGGAGTEANWLGEVRRDEAEATEQAAACDGEEMGAFIAGCISVSRMRRRKREKTIEVRSMSVFATFKGGKKPGVVWWPAQSVERAGKNSDSREVRKQKGDGGGRSRQKKATAKGRGCEPCPVATMKKTVTTRLGRKCVPAYRVWRRAAWCGGDVAQMR